jgi:hypothetical protein
LKILRQHSGTFNWLSKLMFPIREVDAFVFAHSWLILQSDGYVLSVAKLSKQQQELAVSLKTRLSESEGFVNARHLVEEFGSREAGPLFHNVTLYRFLLCYCGFSLVLVPVLGKRKIEVFACLPGDSSAILRCLLMFLHNVSTAEVAERVRNGMSFLQECTVSAIENGAPVKYVLWRHQQLSLAISRSVGFALDGLHTAELRWDFMQMWRGFLASFQTGSAASFREKFMAPVAGGG